MGMFGVGGSGNRPYRARWAITKAFDSHSVEVVENSGHPKELIRGWVDVLLASLHRKLV